MPVATLVNLRPLPQVFVGGQVLQGVQSMGVGPAETGCKKDVWVKASDFHLQAICSNQQVNGSDMS